jgi:Ca2+-binding EF-hand superfamily protein
MVEEIDHKGEIARERFKRKGKEVVLTETEEDDSVENVYKERVFDDDASEMSRRFAICLHEKFPNIRSAFEYFDDTSSGQVFIGDFLHHFSDLRFGSFVGDPKQIFEALDTNAGGALTFDKFCNLKKYIRTPAPEYAQVESKIHSALAAREKDIISKRQRRSPIPPPGEFKRGSCLVGTHVSHPLGERVGSSAGFYSFARSTTGRLDPLLHPCDLPGYDSFNFRAEGGPGCVDKGPEYFPESACHTHPTRGNKFKVGSNMNKQPKLKALIPSRQPAEVQACRDAAFCTHEGIAPQDTWKVHGGGAVHNKGERYSATFGTADSFGLMAPKPVGFWRGSRMANSLLTQSAPSLLHTKC